MKLWKKLAVIIVLALQVTRSESQVLQDSIKTQTQQIEVINQPQLKLPEENKRQRNKTGITVLVSCLFIISTTILLYNVRSK
jgi:hypothetical protein